MPKVYRMDQRSEKQQHRIIVRFPNWTGDIVMATPVLQCLRQNFPKSRIVGVVRSYARGVLKDLDDIDRIIPCDDKTISGLRQTGDEIREENPDFAVVLPNSFRSWLQMRLGGVKEIYGYRRGLRKLFMRNGPKLSKKSGTASPSPMIDYYLGICRDMRLTVADNPCPGLAVSTELQEKGDATLKRLGVDPEETIIGINPGASFGSSKCWPVENFAALAELFENHYGGRLLLFGSPSEKELTKAITEQSKAEIINTAPLDIDLEHLKPLIKRCNLLVTNDTGPRHYAVAFGIPVTVIMGPTHPAYTAANLDQTVVVREDVSCGPCHKKTCPYNHECMTRITPENVFNSAVNLLGVHGE